MARAKSAFALMSDSELLEHCRKLVAEQGLGVLTFKSLKALKLYFPLYTRGLTQDELLKRLGVTEQYAAHVAQTPLIYRGEVRERWSWERVVRIASETAQVHGHLPPAGWFQRNELASLVFYVYQLGHTWDELQVAVTGQAGGNFVESRNGLRWLSHAEASLSNFLYARGIEHRKGERYPEEYADVGQARYAIFDMHFTTPSGRVIDVEIWGDNPNGHGREAYAQKRESKEAFNQDNSNFLGIDHETCYREDALAAMLLPYIGSIEPFQFDRPTDPVIPSTHWSNADELLVHCRQLASEMPDGIFPTESWLRKRGRHADRPGEAYNTLSVYIKLWLGGVRNLREILGQEHASTTVWTKELAIDAYRLFLEKHQATPGQVRGDMKNGVREWPADVLAEAGRVAAAVEKFGGGTQSVRAQLGLEPTRRSWDADSVVAAFDKFAAQHGMTPRKAVSLWERQADCHLSAEDSRFAGTLVSAYKRLVGTLPREGQPAKSR